MCRQTVTYDARAEDISPGEVVRIFGRLRIVERVSREGRQVLLEGTDGQAPWRHYTTPDRLFTVMGEGER